MEIFLSDLLKEEGRESRVNFYNAFKERKEIEVIRAEDVVKGIDYCLVQEHYKLRTSQKKMVSQRDREDRCQKLWLSFSPVPHCRRQKQNNPKLSKLQ